MVKSKLTKRERLQITYAIEYILDGYCRAECPFFNLNTPSAVCSTCPAQVKLREHGKKLVSDDKREEYIRSLWTDEENSFLIKHHGKKKVKVIAEALKRTPDSVYDRVRILKRKGLI